jgi:hypothetical protein
MNNKINKLITIMCLFSSMVMANAVQITEENDFFRRNDNQYTQGADISYIIPSVDKDGNYQREIYGASQKIYAPDNKDTKLFQPYDRPYCATLTAHYDIWTKGSLFKNETVRQTFEVGVLGPLAMGEQAQNGVHKMINNDLAMGWDTQLKNEPVANYYHERYTPFLNFKNGLWEFNVEAIYGGTAGTEFANAFGGSKLMFGYNLPQYKVLGGIYPKGIKDGKIECKTEWYFYGFVQEKVYTVARDTTLGNSIFNGSQSSITPYPIVGESIYGIVIGWDWISISYAIGNRTKEFYEQKGTYDWGQIILSVGTVF